METPTIVYDLDTSGGLMEVRFLCLKGPINGHAIYLFISSIICVAGFITVVAVVKRLA